jgi:Bacteriophage replication protein O
VLRRADDAARRRGSGCAAVREPEDHSAGDYRFDGLETLDGTMFPDALLDHVMANLTGAEFKVLAYIVRRTYGFKKQCDSISLDQICNGVKRIDGRVLDGGTGLSKKTAIAALKGLEDKGVIVANRRRTHAGSLPTAFAIRHRYQLP